MYKKECGCIGDAIRNLALSFNREQTIYISVDEIIIVRRDSLNGFTNGKKKQFSISWGKPNRTEKGIINKYIKAGGILPQSITTEYATDSEQIRLGRI